METHEKFMKEALREAALAGSEDEVPIGAVVVWKGRVIAKGHNMTERLADPTGGNQRSHRDPGALSLPRRF